MFRYVRPRFYNGMPPADPAFPSLLPCNIYANAYNKCMKTESNDNPMLQKHLASIERFFSDQEEKAAKTLSRYAHMSDQEIRNLQEHLQKKKNGS